MSKSVQESIDELRKAFPPHPLDPERLTLEQKRAVARALETLEAAAVFEHNRQDLAEVLDSY